MKKIVKRFKQMDNTKKIVLSFITISLLIIISLTIFNQINNNNSASFKRFSDYSIALKEKSEDKKDTNTINSSNQKQENNNSNNNPDQSVQTDNTGNKSTFNNETTTNKNETSKTVSIQISGVNKTISAGNITINSGDSVYDALKKYCSNKGLNLTTSGFGSTIYITGIGGLNEFDYGNRSGWMYMVDGVSPNTGVANYSLKGNEKVVIYYVNYE